MPLSYHLSKKLGIFSDLTGELLLKREINDRTIERVCSRKEPAFLKKYFLAKRESLKREDKEKLFETLIELVGEEKAFSFLEELADKDEGYFDVDAMGNHLKQITPRIKVKDTSSLSEYSVEDIERDKDVKYVQITSDNTSVYMIYSRNEYIRVQNAFADLLQDVPFAKKGDAKSEYEVYKILNDRISKRIKFHSGSSKREIREERNLLALPNGQGVCLGKSRVLKYALKERNIDAHVIFGYLRTKSTDKVLRKILGISAPNDGSAFEDHQEPKNSIMKYKLLPNVRMNFYEKNKGGHAWTQAEIGGEWYNGDITNLSKSNCLLFSDSEFKTERSRYYYQNNSFSDKHIPCTNSFREKYHDLITDNKTRYTIDLAKIKRAIALYRERKAKEEKDE